ncbi:hypothetical protein RD792_000807 [Penstemon davidsonii]|uniref:UTP-monosaccharide-1-phosphate uridylyltransferase n=1 Tax=Penstemon davidsonii TaxID=160366 RepID=A0ABR0DMF7_9LAMI|nr:hypothetical protein RD792_000807 [Penstemon davidsonii]
MDLTNVVKSSDAFAEARRAYKVSSNWNEAHERLQGPDIDSSYRAILTAILRSVEVEENNDKPVSLRQKGKRGRENIDEAPPIEKRGRGRPRKQIRQNIAEIEENNDVDVSFRHEGKRGRESIDHAPPREKRGRGRPRKQAGIDEAPPREKRGRGRPRKQAPPTNLRSNYRESLLNVLNKPFDEKEYRELRKHIESYIDYVLAGSDVMASSTVGSTADSLSKLDINDWASAAPNLQKNLSLLSSQQVELAKMLLEMNQSHLFEHWPEPGVNDDDKLAFLEQVARLNASYPGGLASYIKTARELLADSKAGKNPYDGFSPSVPSGEALTFGDDKFVQYEDAGVREARKAVFVLVAGGLGERLGYNGIKVALPLESTTGTCFLQHYIESILALQETSCRLAQGEGLTEIPLAIMTSDDTHLRTIKLLESNAYFGMKPTQIKLLKQEKVACLDDNDARLAVDPHNKYIIQTKPHGHGDVHSLLYSSGLLKEWLDAGRKWVLFFQDTNGLLFKAIPAALGVSATNEYHVNSLAVPRKAKEAIGGITKLTHQDGRTMVINVEYNQLDPLLRATGNPDGDVNCETGYSPFPGNINQIQGFYTKLRSSHLLRLECMMQDYPKTLPPSAKVGFTVMDTWYAYAPVKNNPEDAAKVPKGNPYHSATSGEMAIYRANSLILRKAGVKVADPVNHVFNGQEVEVFPRIVWKPKWGLTFSDIRSKVNGNCSITQRSTIAIKGRNIYLEDLALDGALVLDAIDDARGMLKILLLCECSISVLCLLVWLFNLQVNAQSVSFVLYQQVKVGGSVQNAGCIIQSVDFKDTSVPEEVRIRGFKIIKVEQLEKTYSEPGKFSLKL